MVDEVIQEFLLETRENLDVLDNELVAMEEVGADKRLLDSIFRSVHTIKGTCGFLELSKMEKVAHVGEGLLSKLRDGKLEVSKPIVDALLGMGDALRSMLDAVETTGQDGANDYPALVATLTALRDGGEALPEVCVVLQVVLREQLKQLRIHIKEKSKVETRKAANGLGAHRW